MTSREQFEAAWGKNNECEPMDGWESLRCDDGYMDEIIDGQWWAWQASREALKPVAWAHRLINKHSGVAHPWVYGSAEKVCSEGDVFRVEVMPLYSNEED